MTNQFRKPTHSSVFTYIFLPLSIGWLFICAKFNTWYIHELKWNKTYWNESSSCWKWKTWSCNFPTCRMEQSIKPHMTKNSLWITEWQDCVIIMYYCNADPQSRGSRKVITAVASDRDSYNIFQCESMSRLLGEGLTLHVWKLQSLRLYIGMGGNGFFSLSMWLYVFAFLPWQENQPPQHDRPAAMIFHLSQFELLFTKNLCIFTTYVL